jgi:hypothetical protein
MAVMLLQLLILHLNLAGIAHHQCKKHIHNNFGETSPMSFRSLGENLRRKQGKIGNISQFHFLGRLVAVLFQILV